MAAGIATRFNMNQAWSTATAMLSDNRQVVAIIAGVFFFLPNALGSLFSGSVNNAAFMSQSNDPSAALAALGAGSIFLLIIMSMASLIGSLALQKLLTDPARPTVGEALKFGLSAFLPALAAGLLVGIGAAVIFVPVLLLIGLLAAVAGGGVISAIIGGIAIIIALCAWMFVMVRVSLVSPAIAVGGIMNPVQAIKSSWHLTKENFWPLLGFYIVLYIAIIVVMIVITLLAAGLGALLGEGFAVFLTSLVGGVIQAVIACLLLAILAAVYLQLTGGNKAAAADFE